MSTNKQSIIYLITLFFILVFTLINALFWIAHQHFYKQYEIEQIQRFLLADRLFHHHNQQDFSIELEQLMIQISNVSNDKLLLEGKVVLELPFGKMIQYKNHTFFINLKPPPPNDMFEQFIPPSHIHDFQQISLQDVKPHSLNGFWLVLGAVDGLILLFFFYLIKKLLPLHKLKSAIIAFKDGDTNLNITIDSNDEISDITHEFNSKLKKIAAMREARSLFLRNILHELKTPIMKGSLTTECLDASTEQERLKRIFTRMDYLLNEFAKMEHFSSGEWQLNIREYRFVDLLDHACDMLLCDKTALHVQGEESQLILKVDFELFAIALKNLIDNALKYSDTKPNINISKEAIQICSVGKEIPQAKQNFNNPFNRDFEDSSAGLGLGLYISHSILIKHNLQLHYTYQDEYNCFSILLN